MIKSIESLTVKEFLRQQLKKDMVLTCPIRPGENIDFSPNEITLKKINAAGIKNE